MYEHRYPTECPFCYADLRSCRSVEVEFCSNGGGTWTTKSSLSESGLLEDPTGDIARGHHSDTYCNRCDSSLAEHEILDEEPA
jgi:hypothetical protein